MTARRVVWTLDDALTVCRWLEEALAPAGYHVALGGGVLLRGYSHKDLDVLIYPRNVLAIERDKAAVLLQEAGFQRWMTVEQVQAMWRKIGSTPSRPVAPDNKTVEVWRFDGKRIDLFWVK